MTAQVLPDDGRDLQPEPPRPPPGGELPPTAPMVDASLIPGFTPAEMVQGNYLRSGPNGSGGPAIPTLAPQHVPQHVQPGAMQLPVLQPAQPMLPPMPSAILPQGPQHAFDHNRIQADVRQRVQSAMQGQQTQADEMARRGQALAQQQQMMQSQQAALQQAFPYVHAWRDGGRLEALDIAGSVWQYNEALQHWTRLSNARDPSTRY